jgi:hypothetical protein
MHPFVGNCRACGYPLLRLRENRCPECGTAFDPNDPKTMDFGWPKVTRFLERPSTVWTYAPLGVAVVAAGGAGLAGNPEAASGLLSATVLVGMATLYVVTARWRFRRFMRQRAERQRAEAAAAARLRPPERAEEEGGA